MRFNHTVTLLVSTGILSVMSGCGWVKDSPKATQAFQAKAFDLNCMNTTPEKLQNLFDGAYTASPADKMEIESIWQCLDKGLNTFSAYTTGANPNYYDSVELQQFANRYLPSDKPIDAAFIKAIFRLKMAVIGGSETSINRQEIARLREKLSTFGKIIEPLAPYLKVLLAPTTTTSETTRKEASTQLNLFVLSLADVLGDSANPVQWSDLLNFVWELEQYTSVGQKSALTFLREEIPVIQYFKLLIVGGSDTSIEQNKWTPIFQSISHLYDAICLTSSNVELLQHLGFDVQSTEDEQKRAVTILIETFKTLKADTTLQSHDQIVTLSDRFGQLLLLNSVLFPRSSGSLALKPFLSTESMRTLTGYIMDELPGATTSNIDQQAHLQKLVEDVDSLLDQAAISNASPTGVNTPLSLSALQDYVEVLRPLFKKTSEADVMIAGIQMMRDIVPIITGRDTDHLAPKDLKNILQKGVDAYIVWKGISPKGLFEQIGATLDIINREPVAATILQKQALAVVDDVTDLLTKMNYVPAAGSSLPDWAMIKSWIEKGFKTKALLFQNSELSLSSYELSQLAYLWDPFRRNSDLSVALMATANLLANRPFADVKISDLMSVANSFMATPDTLAHAGVDATVLGDIKGLLVGGAKDTISGQDYANLTRAFATIYAQIEPELKTLPVGYQAGLDSHAIGMAEGFFQGFINVKKDEIALTDLKTLFQDVLKTSGYPMRDATLNETLAGLYTRLFVMNSDGTTFGSKGTKITSIAGVKISSKSLSVFLPLLESMRVELADIEKSYVGLDIKQQTLSRATLLAKLKNPANLSVVKNIQPLLDGTVHEHHLPKKGAPRDQFFEYDLAYKALVLSAVNWITPYYKIEADDAGPKANRLSLNDLTDLLTDINDLVLDLKLSLAATSPAESAVARMQNMNIFTQVGNGDRYMDPLEAVEFLTFTAGGQVLLSQVEDTVFKACFPGVTDYSTIQKIPYACLSRVAFTKAYMQKVYGPVIPQLVDQYQNYTAADLESYRKSAFTATSASWTENGSMPVGDFETFVALPYFLENIFEHLDVNNDDTLRFSELMAGFPVFCNEISDAGGGKLKGSCVPGEDPKQIEAVYGYLIFNGHPPSGHGLGGILEIELWFGKWKRLNKDPAVRDLVAPILGRQDLLSILSNLSASTASTATTAASQ